MNEEVKVEETKPVESQTDNLNDKDIELEKLQKKKEKKKKKKIGRIIGNAIFGVIVLIVILEAVIGIINMKKINDGEEPVWYLSTEKTEEANKIVTEYNLGLYRIVKTDTDRDTRIVLKLFFLED